MAGDKVCRTMCCIGIDQRLQHDDVFRGAMHCNVMVTLPLTLASPLPASKLAAKSLRFIPDCPAEPISLFNQNWSAGFASH